MHGEEEELSRSIFIVLALLALTACSADSLIERKMQPEYEQALAGGKDCLASAVASEILRATDTSDNRQPTLFQGLRWGKWEKRADESAAKCRQRYEQAVAAADHCALAQAAEEYAALIQFQATLYARRNMSRKQAIFVSDLQAKAAESNEKCRHAGSGQVADQGATGGALADDGVGASAGQPAPDEVQVPEIARDFDGQGNDEVSGGPARPSGGYAGMLDDMARRRIDLAENSGGAAISPSFNCARAGTAAENAICNDAVLAALDVRLATLYRQVRSTAPDVWDVEQVQRSWLVAQRDACGSDVACLARVYRERMDTLSSP